MDILKIINKAREDKERKELQNAAFVGWQITEFLKGAFSKNAKSQTFEKYLENFGLIDKPKTTKEERQTAAAHAIAKAEARKLKDKRRKG